MWESVSPKVVCYAKSFELKPQTQGNDCCIHPIITMYDLGYIYISKNTEFWKQNIMPEMHAYLGLRFCLA